MMIKNVFLIVVFAIFLSPIVSDSSDKPSKNYGENITLKKVTLIHKAIKNPGKFKDQTILIEGKVTSVCPNTGCWFEISDGKEKIRVKSNHQFFVPYDSEGKKVKAQGKIYTKVVKEPSHCDVSEEEVKKIVKETKIVLFEATGASIEGGGELTQEQLDKIEGKSSDDEHGNHKHDD